MGVVGLETSFAAVYTTMVKTGLISLERLIELMTIAPRRILGLAATEGIRKGMTADLTLLDTSVEWVVNPDNFKTKGRATPYDGVLLQGGIAATIYRGNKIF